MGNLSIKEYFKQGKEEIAAFRDIVGLSILIVDATDGDVGNQIYIRNKLKDFEDVGWHGDLATPVDDTELWKLVSRISLDYDATIVQMPISKKFTINPLKYLRRWKDCDGLVAGSPVVPATVRGVLDYLDYRDFEYAGKSAVMLGRSEIVGKPMARELLKRDMTVTVCHSKTNLEDRRRALAHADLIVSAVGKKGLFSREEINGETIVMDVGISRDKDGKIYGDFVEIPELVEGGGWSTPVPGGVGLLTRLGLLRNCVTLASGSKKCLK